MNPLVILLILIALFLALMCYACLIVGSDYERQSEAYIEQKRIREEQQKGPTGK